MNLIMKLRCCEMNRNENYFTGKPTQIFKILNADGAYKQTVKFIRFVLFKIIFYVAKLEY